MAKTFEQGLLDGSFEKRQQGCKKGHEPYFRVTTGRCITCERDASRKYMSKKIAEQTEEEKKQKAKYNREFRKSYNKREDVVKKRRKRDREIYASRKEQFAEKNRKYRTKNPDKIAFHAAKSRRGKKNATPKWLSVDQWSQIESYYSHARDCMITSGERYDVDHIFPLKGKSVCGLHVPWNLQILPRDVNISKKNSYNEGEVKCS